VHNADHHNNEESAMKQTRIVITAVILALMGIALIAAAGPQQNLEKALVYLQKARATTAVKVKNANLKNAKDQILQSNYTRGGHGSSAVALVMQALSYVNDYKLDKANTMIDAAQVKVKRAIQAIKQEAAEKSKAKGK
jgi:hypothetical protein